MNGYVKGMLKMVNGMLENWMAKRAVEVRFPADVEVISDIPYIDDGRACHKMDIYRPKYASNPLPVVVNLHGGGMLLCTKEVNRPFCGELAKRGFLVFCMEYPLVPEATIPQMLEDASRGMDKVNDLIETYGGDRNRVYQVGDSAGAFLTVYTVAAQRNPELASVIPVTPSALPVKALGLISGMYYTTLNDQVGWFLRKDFYGKRWRRHPMHKFYHPDRPQIAGSLPPCFLVTSKSDNLHGYTKKFRKGLKKAGTSFRLMDFPLLKNLQHDFVIVKPEHPASQQVINEMTEFLLEYR